MRRKFFLRPIEVSAAHFIPPPTYAGRRAKAGTAAARGYAHEDKLHRHLGENPLYVPSPWLSYTTVSGYSGECQPDGLVFQPDRGRIVIMEAKLRHCAEAYFQLVNLYGPIIQFMFPAWSIGYQEVVRWYSANEHFPGPHTLRANLLDPPAGKVVGVHIFEGKR